MKYFFRKWIDRKSLAGVITIAATVLVATGVVSPAARANDSEYTVNYIEEIDLLSSLNRRITLSLLPKYVKNVDYVPDDALFPCTKTGATLRPTKHPPRKCHYLTASVGNEIPTYIFVLDGQSVTSIIEERYPVPGNPAKNVRKLLRSWENNRSHAPMVSGPNPALYIKEHGG